MSQPTQPVHPPGTPKICLPVPRSLLQAQRTVFNDYDPPSDDVQPGGATSHKKSPLRLTISNTGHKPLPADLQGHVFIMAPVGTLISQGLPTKDGDSFTCGDGMIYRLDFDRPGEVWLTTQLTRGPDYWADYVVTKDPNHRFNQYAFEDHGMIRFSTRLGVRNLLNVAFLPIPDRQNGQERLLVTYDGGRQYEIDTQTLQVVTPIGSNQEWEPEVRIESFPFLPLLSTGHPVFDAATGELFTVNYTRPFQSFLDGVLKLLPDCVQKLIKQFQKWLKAQKIKLQIGATQVKEKKRLDPGIKIEISDDFTYLIRWDGQSDLERWQLVHSDDQTPVIVEQSVHQIGITQDYVVLADSFFTTGAEQVLNRPPSMVLEKGLEGLRRAILKLIPESFHSSLPRFLRKRVHLDFVRTTVNQPPTSATLVYFVSRQELRQKPGKKAASNEPEVTISVVKAELPPEITHFLVDYDNPDGRVTLHAVHATSWYASEWIRIDEESAYPEQDTIPCYLHGALHSEMDLSQLGRYVIDATTGALVSSQMLPDAKQAFDLSDPSTFTDPAFRLMWGTILYTYRDRFPTPTGVDAPSGKINSLYWTSLGLWKDLLTRFSYEYYKDRRKILKPKFQDIYHTPLVHPKDVLKLGKQGMPSSLFRVDTATMTIADGYEFEPGYMTVSPQFVPRQDSSQSTEGYILCTVYCPESRPNQHEIWIFEADNLKQGPQWKLSHEDLTFGLSLHTAWLSKIGPRQANYKISPCDDYQDYLKAQTQRPSPDSNLLELIHQVSQHLKS